MEGLNRELRQIRERGTGRKEAQKAQREVECGVMKCELRKGCFLKVLGSEMVQMRAQILTKSDGEIAVFC